jgi:DNA polymerase-3 subunit delta
MPTRPAIFQAAGAGTTGPALAECDRSLAAGESAQAVIAVLQRHFLRLHRMRSALDAGSDMEDVVRSLRPPPHFRQRQALERAARLWSAPRLAAALAHIARAASAARTRATLEDALAENLLLDLGALAQARAGADHSVGPAPAARAPRVRPQVPPRVPDVPKPT